MTIGFKTGDRISEFSTSDQARAARELICDYCRNFYALGWVSGTGGGVSIKKGDVIFMAPSGVEKEKIQPHDIFELDLKGNVTRHPRNEKLKLTECAPLFMSAFEMRNAGAVLHSHSSNVVVSTMYARRVQDRISVLEFTELEMIKGLSGFGYHDVFELPVVDNTAKECDLTESLREAIEKYPKSSAVAVRNHGIYVWGKDEVQAKTQAECIDFLCEVLVKMREIGITRAVHPMGV